MTQLEKAGLRPPAVDAGWEECARRAAESSNDNETPSDDGASNGDNASNSGSQGNDNTGDSSTNSGTGDGSGQNDAASANTTPGTSSSTDDSTNSADDSPGSAQNTDTAPNNAFAAAEEAEDSLPDMGIATSTNQTAENPYEGDNSASLLCSSAATDGRPQDTLIFILITVGVSASRRWFA